MRLRILLQEVFANLSHRSLAFLIYAIVVSCIRLWAVSGRNGGEAPEPDGEIELAPTNKWYSRVPNADGENEMHVIGEDD